MFRFFMANRDPAIFSLIFSPAATAAVFALLNLHNFWKIILSTHTKPLQQSNRGKWYSSLYRVLHYKAIDFNRKKRGKAAPTLCCHNIKQIHCTSSVSKLREFQKKNFFPTHTQEIKTCNQKGKRHPFQVSRAVKRHFSGEGFLVSLSQLVIPSYGKSNLCHQKAEVNVQYKISRAIHAVDKWKQD